MSLFLAERVANSIAMLQKWEPKIGYWLAFSGGKDSVVIDHLAQRAGVKYTKNFSNTGLEAPELYRFIRQHHPDAIWHKPQTTMWQLIEKKRMPPTRIIRYCCDHLKEQHGTGMIVVGVRKSESNARAKLKPIEIGMGRKEAIFIRPILEWNDSDIWEYIRSENIPYCSLYDEGFKRLGCVMCPMQGGKGQMRDAKRWPQYYRLYMRAFEKAIQKRKDDNMLTEGSKFETAESMMSWWTQQK